MDIQADIKWIMAELRQVKDPQLIEVFKNLLRYRKSNEGADWWELISDDERTEIEKGLIQIKNDEVIPHDEVMKDPRKWA